MSAVLSLSSPSLDCGAVVALLQTLGLTGDVTANRTVVGGREEQGCRTVLRNKDEARSLWRAAKNRPDIHCAHVSVQQAESGCVFDVFGDSACPGPGPR
jgi:hypothetical protein